MIKILMAGALGLSAVTLFLASFRRSVQESTFGERLAFRSVCLSLLAWTILEFNEEVPGVLLPRSLAWDRHDATLAYWHSAVGGVFCGGALVLCLSERMLGLARSVGAAVLNRGTAEGLGTQRAPGDECMRTTLSKSSSKGPARGTFRTQWRPLLIVLMAASLSFLFFAFVGSSGVDSRARRVTLACLRTLSRDLAATIEAEPALRQELLTGTTVNANATATVELNRSIAALFLRSHAGTLDSLRMLNADGSFRDGWGSVMNFAVVANGTNFNRLSDRLRLASGSVAVWSSGPNKVSDYGYGDDVVLAVK